tara:strand:+ start:15177 stop:15629 length:453 start_codon:yes stop_codon:yes gene_type:complete
MYNLREGKGTFKGLIGECMFKLTRKNLILTRFFGKNKFFKIFSTKISYLEREFLYKNWFSIDAIEFDYSQKPRKIVLFEIKTQNYYRNRKFNWKPKMTLATHNIYKEALRLEFDVKMVIIELYDAWDYDAKIKDFNESDYYIDKPKRYDK